MRAGFPVRFFFAERLPRALSKENNICLPDLMRFGNGEGR
jgi:hypothetical protein